MPAASVHTRDHDGNWHLAATLKAMGSLDPLPGSVDSLDFLRSRQENVVTGPGPATYRHDTCLQATIADSWTTANTSVVIIPQMDGSGTITWETFLENAESFLRVSDKLLDGWTFHGEKDVPGQAYLARQAKIFIPIDDGMVNSAEATDDWCEELGSVLQEDPFVGASSPESPLITEHHILWSLSYSVPVLYFNAWKSDFSGMNVVSVEEVQKYLHHLDLKYTELSQAIHPIVGTPFLFLHPCMSHELLRNTAKSKNQLVSWLSSVAPAAFHLNLNTEYYKLT